MLRWIGFARYGVADFAELRDCGALSREDYDAIQPAYAFLLWLRNELHFHSGQASDVLTRAEQLRLAERAGRGSAHVGHHVPMRRVRPTACCPSSISCATTSATRTASATWPTKFLAKATTNPWIDKTLTLLFGHRIESDYLVGPVGMMTRGAAWRGSAAI